MRKHEILFQTRHICLIHFCLVPAGNRTKTNRNGGPSNKSTGPPGGNSNAGLARPGHPMLPRIKPPHTIPWWPAISGQRAKIQ